MYYACICLVGYDVLDLLRRESVAGEKLLDHVGKYPDRELEDFTAILKELLVACWMPGPSERGPPAVGPQDVVYKARVAIAGIEYDRAGAVAEKNGRRAIAGVDDGAHGVRPDQQDPAGRPGSEHGRSDGSSVGESGARRGEVHRAGAGSPDLLPDQARDRRHGFWCCRGAADHEVDRSAVNPGVLEGPLRGLYGERRRVLSFGDEVARLDTGAGRDPVVRRVEYPLQVAVGDDPAPESPADADDPARSTTVQADLPSEGRTLCAASACCSSPVRPAPMYEMPRSAFSTPVACEFPCPITTELLTPSRKEPPYSSGSTVSLTSISLGRRMLAASLLRTSPVIAERTMPRISRATPSAVLSTTLPVKPSVTSTSATPRLMSRPSTFPTKRIPDSSMRRWASLARSLPFPGSSPTLTSPTRASPSNPK